MRQFGIPFDGDTAEEQGTCIAACFAVCGAAIGDDTVIRTRERGDGDQTKLREQHSSTKILFPGGKAVSFLIVVGVDFAPVTAAELFCLLSSSVKVVKFLFALGVVFAPEIAAELCFSFYPRGLRGPNLTLVDG